MTGVEFYRMLLGLQTRVKHIHERLVSEGCAGPALDAHWALVSAIDDERERVWDAMPEAEREEVARWALGRATATTPPPEPEGEP